MATLSNIQFPEPFNQLSCHARYRRELHSGQTLFCQGDASRGMFYVVDGILEMRRTSEAGHNIIMFRATSGDTFAEASLFQKSYLCDAVALERTHVVEFPREALLKLCQTDIAFACAMSQRFALQIHQSRMRLELHSIKSAEERVYRAIVEGLLCGSARSLANEIGLSAEAVYRALRALCESGRIRKIKRGHYSVVNTKKQTATH